MLHSPAHAARLGVWHVILTHMLIDEATIMVEAGDGGDGKVAFFPNYGKPAGGSVARNKFECYVQAGHRIHGQIML